MTLSHIRQLAFCVLFGTGLAGLAGCKEAVEPVELPPLEVQVQKVEQEDVPIFFEWIGTTDGLVNAKIRAQVTGYLLKQHYREGATVKKGDLLFEIDPRKFQAALKQAAGELDRAQAQRIKAEYDVVRNEPLAQEGAISQKEFQDSVQTSRAATASVESAAASLDQAKLNLEWTKVVAPIDGVVGVAKAQIGDLVNSSDELTSMSQLDPIRVYFPVSEQEYLRFSSLVQERYRAKEDPRIIRDDGRIEMVLSNGEVYQHKGWFFLADRQVDAKTGTIRIAALFPNSENVLRPGLYAKVRTALAVRKGALLVAQRAVSETQGRYQVAVVTPENNVEIRSVTVGERVGSQWIIAQGLAPGEQVIVDGLQKLKPGVPVHPVPFSDNSSIANLQSLPRSK
ncbi:MAG: efflux RND transporter periplasmic adaptor subunit [Nitrospira sp. BO4]|jgi:membrane fusion protein (multidrug efflux system)|nr:efflux RND transporter periplasmic adaptor subunit [Nitrospira sp. BO4]